MKPIKHRRRGTLLSLLYFISRFPYLHVTHAVLVYSLCLEDSSAGVVALSCIPQLLCSTHGQGLGRLVSHAFISLLPFSHHLPFSPSPRPSVHFNVCLCVSAFPSAALLERLTYPRTVRHAFLLPMNHITYCFATCIPSAHTFLLFFYSARPGLDGREPLHKASHYGIPSILLPCPFPNTALVPQTWSSVCGGQACSLLPSHSLCPTTTHLILPAVPFSLALWILPAWREAGAGTLREDDLTFGI